MKKKISFTRNKKFIKRVGNGDYRIKKKSVMKNTDTAYKLYRHYKMLESRKLSDRVLRKEFIAGTNIFFEFFAREIIDNGTEINIPKLGQFVIQGFKSTPVFDEDGEIKNLFIDWVETKKLNENRKEGEKYKFVKFFNEHSDGFFYKMVWKRNNGFKSVHNFSFYPRFKKRMAKNIKENKVKYEKHRN